MCLVSGTSSGFGRYLSEEIPSLKYKRNDDTYRYFQVKTIIHCAWGGDVSKPAEYITNAINLVEKLIKIPHEQFIFLSSIDVYPKNGELWTEYDEIDPREICGIYALTKYAVEQLVLKTATNPLIIRPSILLGPYTQGTIKTVATGSLSDMRTSTWSDYNLVLYSDILEFIRYSKDKLTGVFNTTSRKNVKLHELIPMSSPDDKFVYNAGNISNMKAACFFENFNRTSREVFQIWKKQYYY